MRKKYLKKPERVSVCRRVLRLWRGFAFARNVCASICVTCLISLVSQVMSHVNESCHTAGVRVDFTSFFFIVFLSLSLSFSFFLSGSFCLSRGHCVHFILHISLVVRPKSCCVPRIFYCVSRTLRIFYFTCLTCFVSIRMCT